MRKILLIIAIALQVLVLAFMAGKREYLMNTGTVVYLRTAPIDPRDLFRGDYVRLRYEASLVPFSKCSPDIADKVRKYSLGSVVYAQLTVGENGLAEVTALSAEKPAAGTFIKGRLAQPWQFGIAGPDFAGVQYGIEAYYVQEGKGLEIEKQQGTRNTLQTPIEMEIALGGDGTAVIRGYRWSPLSIGLETIEGVRQNEPLANQQTATANDLQPASSRRSARLKLTLKNTSEKPLAIVNLAGMCSILMEPVSPGQQTKVPERSVCTNIAPTDADIQVLQPEELRVYEVDLAEPQWQVLRNNVLTETGTLDWNERFRFIYHPPSADAAAQLKDAAMIWHGRLPSRAFHGRGNID